MYKSLDQSVQRIQTTSSKKGAPFQSKKYSIMQFSALSKLQKQTSRNQSMQSYKVVAQSIKLDASALITDESSTSDASDVSVSLEQTVSESHQEVMIGSVSSLVDTEFESRSFAKFVEEEKSNIEHSSSRNDRSFIDIESFDGSESESALNDFESDTTTVKAKIENAYMKANISQNTKNASVRTNNIKQTKINSFSRFYSHKNSMTVTKNESHFINYKPVCASIKLEVNSQSSIEQEQNSFGEASIEQMINVPNTSTSVTLTNTDTSEVDNMSVEHLKNEDELDEYSELVSHFSDDGYSEQESIGRRCKAKMTVVRASNNNYMHRDLFKYGYLVNATNIDKFSNISYAEDMDPEYLSRHNATFKKSTKCPKLSITSKKVVVLSFVDKKKVTKVQSTVLPSRSSEKVETVIELEEIVHKNTVESRDDTSIFKSETCSLDNFYTEANTEVNQTSAQDFVCFTDTNKSGSLLISSFNADNKFVTSLTSVNEVVYMKNANNNRQLNTNAARNSVNDHISRIVSANKSIKRSISKINRSRPTVNNPKKSIFSTTIEHRQDTTLETSCDQVNKENDTTLTEGKNITSANFVHNVHAFTNESYPDSLSSCESKAIERECYASEAREQHLSTKLRILMQQSQLSKCAVTLQCRNTQHGAAVRCLPVLHSSKSLPGLNTNCERSLCASRSHKSFDLLPA